MSGRVDPAALVAGCEAEQLHLSGAIQGFGCLLVLDPDGQRISHVAANVDTWLGVPADALVGRPSDSLPWLGELLAAWLPQRKPGQHKLFPRACRRADDSLDAWLVDNGPNILVELQPSRLAPPLPMHRLQLPLLSAPGERLDLAAFHGALLDGIREITGFDRVMLYRFHEDYSGEVIAERTAGGLGSYLGLRFPASDIPAIARRLYLINPWRAIPDIQSPPVPLAGKGTPDLTHALLRSVSPVHLTYLANMGVRASFSVPIRIAGELWGLVACHHLSPLMPDPEACQTAASLARAYAMGMAAWNAEQRMRAFDSLRQRVERIVGDLAPQRSPLDALAGRMPELLELMAADGLSIVSGDHYAATGEVPDNPLLEELDRWFGKRPEALLMTDAAATLVPHLADSLAPLAGIAAARVDGARHGRLRFYWFRREEIQEVAWAGNPDKPQAEDDQATMLAPRRSFARWIEVKQGVSRPWSNQDRLHCMHLRNALLQPATAAPR